LSACLSACLPVYLSAYLPICLPACLLAEVQSISAKTLQIIRLLQLSNELMIDTTFAYSWLSPICLSMRTPSDARLTSTSQIHFYEPIIILSFGKWREILRTLVRMGRLGWAAHSAAGKPKSTLNAVRLTTTPGDLFSRKFAIARTSDRILRSEAGNDLPQQFRHCPDSQVLEEYMHYRMRSRLERRTA
jgi:hypothetical protein